MNNCASMYRLGLLRRPCTSFCKLCVSSIGHENNSLISKNFPAAQAPQSLRRFTKNREKETDEVMKLNVEADADTFGTIPIPNLEKERRKAKKKLLSKIKQKSNEKRTLATSEETENDQNDASQKSANRRKSFEGRRKSSEDQRLASVKQKTETNAVSTKLSSNLSLNPADEFGSLGEPTSFEQAYNLQSLHKGQRHKLEFMEDEKFAEELKIDENEEELAEFQPKAFRHEPNWYHDKCRELAEQGKIAECCAMLEQRMLQEDRVRPTKRNFGVVLQALGEKGFTKKAFELFGKMKQYGLDPIPSHFTSLFNACANSPYPEAALQRVNRLRAEMKQKLYNTVEIQK